MEVAERPETRPRTVPAAAPRMRMAPDLDGTPRSDKILWLLRRVVGVRHILITESRLPDSGPVVLGDRRALAPNLETRSAWRTARCHRERPSRQIPPKVGVARSETRDTPDRGGRSRPGW